VVLQCIIAGPLKVVERTVAARDYMLTLETALFAACAARPPTVQAGSTSWLTVFFGSIWAGSLAGSTVNGFVPRPNRMGNEMLRAASCFASGGTSLATCVVGAKVSSSHPTARLVASGATTALVASLILALFVARPFFIAVVAYVPATWLLLGALVVRYRRTGDLMMLSRATEGTVTFVAAGVQIGRVALHAGLFTLNVLCHLIRAAALPFFVRAGRLLEEADRDLRPATGAFLGWNHDARR